jgi:hypothetical protein
LEISLEIEFRERFLQKVEHDALILKNVFNGDQSIGIDSFGLMDPQLDDLVSSLELRRLSDQQALEHTRDVSKIEFIMEIHSGLSERTANILM